MIEESSSAFSMIPQTGHFGKDKIPIFLPKLQPISDTACRKKDRFGQLASTIYGLLKSHSVAYLTPLIAREVPIKKFTAQQEATKVMHKVWHCVFDVNHLQAIALINTSGKTVNVKSEKLNDRPGGLTFFRLSCEIDSVDINPCIFQKNSTFSSACTFPNTSKMSPPGLSRPSDLPTNTPKLPRGVNVAWLPF